MPASPQELGEYILERLPGSGVGFDITKDHLTLQCPREKLVWLLSFLTQDQKCLFKQLMDICGADYPDREERFEVIYQLLSLHHNRRLTIKVSADENAAVPSVSHIHSTATWFEREVWDMYGVMFTGNPDLRRILTDYGFEGHPMRKDFPLTGYVELRYDSEKQRVVYEPVKLQQEFRGFDFLSPWEGPNYALPGDEKATK